MNGRTINVFWWTTGMTRMKYAVRFDMISGARNGYGGPATMTRTILTSQQKNSGASRICSLLSTSSSLAHFSSIGCFLFTSTHSVACLSTFSVLSTVILFSMVQSPQLLFFFFFLLCISTVAWTAGWPASSQEKVLESGYYTSSCWVPRYWIDQWVSKAGKKRTGWRTERFNIYCHKRTFRQRMGIFPG